MASPCSSRGASSIMAGESAPKDQIVSRSIVNAVDRLACKTCPSVVCQMGVSPVGGILRLTAAPFGLDDATT